MNIVYFFIILMSLGVLIVTAPESAFSAMLTGSSSAISLLIKLLAVYAVWLPILKIIEKSGLDKKFARLMRPITSRLFPGESDEVHALISMNFAANMLGMGGAATPLGIKAMERMDDGNGKITNNMMMLIVIASSSIQLLPTTIIALRSAAGSGSPSDIILPTLIATVFTAFISIFLTRILSK